MNKLSFKQELPSLILLVLAWLMGWYFYQHFPDRVVSHWNFYGQPDAWSSKVANAWGLPAIVSGIYLLFLALPYLDPKKERYAEFARVYHIFKNLMLVVMLLVMAAGGLYNLGYPIPIQYVVPAIVGGLMIILGNYLGKLKQNWFVGIKTPWTLSSENVWNKTHRVGGYLFVIFGLLIITTPLLPRLLGLVAFITGVTLAVGGTFGYSYWIYTKEKS